MTRRKRIPKGKKINPAYFVFCEGKTEELYIAYLKSKYRLPITINSKIAGQNISAKYIKNYMKGKFTHPKDKNCLVYDLDDDNILLKLQEIKDVEIIASNPCFELWYLLHYQEQTSALACDDCCKKLTKHDAKYCKGKIDQDLKLILDKKQFQAINRAKNLSGNRNPSSSVYKIIEDLENVRKDLLKPVP
ncbi:MAG: RloB domain-containing protein [Bacteroidales bacterium]|nr:RloB domain-containing protein [Bacteroidales bacterium]